MDLASKITHADDDLVEIGYIDDYDKLDTQISIRPSASLDDNSWQLTMPDKAWADDPILEGHYVYINSTEWGGQVERIQHNTGTGTLLISGVTWRGMLMRKIIEPPVDAAYLELVDVETNAVISQVVGSQFGSLFTVDDTDTGTTITASWRFTNMHTGLQKALSSVGRVLAVTFDAALKKVVISSRAIVDYSSTIDLSQDYGIALISTQGRMDAYNHVIALGAGELLDRDIVHVYRLDDGTITQTPPAWEGTSKDIVTTYDYTSAETIEDLIEGATKRLLEYKPAKSIQIDPGDADLTMQLGDIVGARDRLTGMAATAIVVEKILTIDSYGVKIDTKVE